jgi:hypothetical protein
LWLQNQIISASSFDRWLHQTRRIAGYSCLRIIMGDERGQVISENPRQPPAEAVLPTAQRRRFWQNDIPPYMVALLFLLGILQYWTLGLLMANGFVGLDFPRAASFATYLVHWSSVGGLIGFAVSKKRGSLIGAIVGLILSVTLMC